VFQGWLKQSCLLETSVLYLNVRFGVNSDPQFPYSGPMLLQFKISFSLTSACLLNDNYKPAYLKTLVYGNVSSILVTQVLAYVHFLNFGELKMRFLPVESIF